jgi:serine protease Do
MKKRFKRYLFVLVFATIIALSITIYDRFIRVDEDTLYQAHLRIVSTSTDGQTKFGSAVIFDDDRNYYYALTNHHVVDGSNNVDAIDYKNNRYDVEVINSRASFDLAIIKIERIERLRKLDFADEVIIDSDVIAVGYPQSIFTLTEGVISTIETIDHEVTVDVIHHSAVIDHGSSGGALINSDYEIVGINFAGYVDANDVVTESYAIPSTRIISYITSVDYA